MQIAIDDMQSNRKLKMEKENKTENNSFAWQ